LLKDWCADDYLACPHCGKSLTASTLRWGKTAGLGRSLIEVWNVFPNEGVPQPMLLKRLAEAFGTAFRYFYAG
jgi:hypothetical protein